MVNVVTLDGPSGVGKSTLAKAVAKALGYCCLDTGAMFRTLALKLGKNAPDLGDEELLAQCEQFRFRMDGAGEDTVLYCNDVPVGSEIRTEDVGVMASKIAKKPVIRTFLKNAQRAMASVALVAEGRDMGTVIFPEARYKFFLDASPHVRAVRRYKELVNNGVAADLAVIEQQIAERDLADRTRAVAPLRPAEDAKIIDTSDLSIDEVLTVILNAVQK